MSASSAREQVGVRDPRVVPLFLIALAIGLAGFIRIGMASPLGSSPSAAVLASPGSAVTTEQSVPVHAASSGDDIGPGQAEPILVGSP